MNVHFGSWIVPLIFTVVSFFFMSTTYARMKARGTLTLTAARKAGFESDDEIVQGLVLILFLGLFSAGSLLVWLVWALVK